MKKIAGIDVGSYTARMLIAEKHENRIVPILRMRDYINIADSFTEQEIILDDATKRCINVLNAFLKEVKKNKVEEICAVGTGVIRRAKNRDDFIYQVKKYTGVGIIPISGKKEAFLTAEGVIYAISLKESNFEIVDIGGGSIEFFIKRGKVILPYSIPIGAAVLQNRFILTDPPLDSEIEKAFLYIKNLLKDRMLPNKAENLIGTGGTIATLAAICHRIPFEMISPENLNGKRISYNQIKSIFEEIRHMDLSERINRFGLDKNRARVIISGTIILLSTIEIFHVFEMTVSLSDILEGIILRAECIREGKRDEK